MVVKGKGAESKRPGRADGVSLRESRTMLRRPSVGGTALERCMAACPPCHVSTPTKSRGDSKRNMGIPTASAWCDAALPAHMGSRPAWRLHVAAVFSLSLPLWRCAATWATSQIDSTASAPGPRAAAHATSASFIYTFALLSCQRLYQQSPASSRRSSSSSLPGIPKPIPRR